jgi:hypothetical protein
MCEIISHEWSRNLRVSGLQRFLEFMDDIELCGHDFSSTAAEDVLATLLYILREGDSGASCGACRRDGTWVDVPGPHGDLASDAFPNEKQKGRVGYSGALV